MSLSRTTRTFSKRDLNWFAPYGRLTAHVASRQVLRLRGCAHHAEAGAAPIPTYVGSFSKPSIELAARLGCGLIVAPFAAAITFGGLKQVADLYHEACARHGTAPGRLMCSYFTHFADTREQEHAQRARQIRYYRECAIPALPGDPKTVPPSYRYFIDMVDRLRKVKPELRS
jgi:alkanesulfonate monooxygenase SsuD/methylene tetrahydromethanopterin reductase-like flavin-dependent oxidoreductase (luciferase family)